MPRIPNTSIFTAEIVSVGSIAAGGSNVIPVENVYHFRRNNTTPTPDKALLEAAFQTSIMIPVTNALNVAYTQTSNKVRWIDDATDPYFVEPRAVAGQVAGARQQAYDAVALIFQTDYRGKSGQGRKHYSPITESDTVGDVLTAGAITLWTDVLNAILAGITDTNGNLWAPVVVSRLLSTLDKNPTNVFWNQIQSGVVDKTTGTMRRRKAKTVVA